MKRIRKLKSDLRSSLFTKPTGKCTSKDVLAAHIINSKMVFLYGRSLK